MKLKPKRIIIKICSIPRNSSKRAQLTIKNKNSYEEKVNIHSGTRLISHMEASADIFSIDNNPYAFYDNDKIVFNEMFICNQYNSEIGEVVFCDYPGILIVDCHPGDGFNYHPKDYKAVILVPFHSATLNTNNIKFKDVTLGHIYMLGMFLRFFYYIY